MTRHRQAVESRKFNKCFPEAPWLCGNQCFATYDAASAYAIWYANRTAGIALAIVFAPTGCVIQEGRQ
jgi:hypothetical protein